MGVVVEKPWGSYEDIFRSDEVVFKKITVVPGEEISLQRHNERSEFWYCVSGHGLMEYGNDTFEVSNGFNIRIPANVKHQLINNWHVDLVVYETQYGLCSEEDIVRLSDKYKRE